MISKKTKSKLQLIVFFLFTFSAIPTVANALPAFPGAEGWGSTTIGGRGGTVIKVTNTNDSGAGSLRAALTASEPRVVIFTAGGTINLSSAITITNPYLTVAGQTAPGGGIQITGSSIEFRTHDVIVRGVRFRQQADVNVKINGDSSNSTHPTYNIVFDHCTFNFGLSGTKQIALWFNPYNVTFSWNIISYSLGTTANSKGLLIGGWDTCGGISASHVTTHHNLFAHNADRNPLIKQETDYTEIINNIVYDWFWYGTWTMAPTYMVGNHYIAGPRTDPSVRPIQVVNGGECLTLQPNAVYVAHNIGPGRATDTGEEWNIVQGGVSIYKRTTPPFPLSGVTEDVVNNVKTRVLAGAGATVPSRDSLDTRVINDITNGTGSTISSISDVGGLPSLASGAPPADIDGDGIPDTWETAHGLNPNNADANIYASSGYTWIEEYINSFFAVSGPSPSPAILIPDPPTNIRIQ